MPRTGTFFLTELYPILDPGELFRTSDPWATYTIGRDLEPEGGRYYVEVESNYFVQARMFFAQMAHGATMSKEQDRGYVPVHEEGAAGVGTNMMYVPAYGWRRV